MPQPSTRAAYTFIKHGFPLAFLLILSSIVLSSSLSLSLGTEYLLITLTIIFTGLAVLVNSLRVAFQLSCVVAFVLLVGFGAMHLVVAFPTLTKLLAVVTLTFGVCAIVYIWLGKVTRWDINSPFK